MAQRHHGTSVHVGRFADQVCGSDRSRDGVLRGAARAVGIRESDQCHGFAPPVAAAPREFHVQAVDMFGAGPVTAPSVDQAQVVERRAERTRTTGVPCHAHGFGQPFNSLVQTACQATGVADEGKRGRQISLRQMSRCFHRVRAALIGVGAVPALLQIVVKVGSDGESRPPAAGLPGGGDQGDEIGPFGIEPGQHLCGAAEFVSSRSWGGARCWGRCAAQTVARGCGQLRKTYVESPRRSRDLGWVPVGLLGPVEPYQVVQGPPFGIFRGQHGVRTRVTQVGTGEQMMARQAGEMTAGIRPGRSSTAAAVAVETSGPGMVASRLRARADSAVRCRYDRSRLARTASGSTGVFLVEFQRVQSAADLA